MTWSPEGDDFRSEAMNTVLNEMLDDVDQPQRALHNWLNDFVNHACSTKVTMLNGRVVKHDASDVISWIRQFCDIYSDVVKQEK